MCAVIVNPVSAKAVAIGAGAQQILQSRNLGHRPTARRALGAGLNASRRILQFLTPRPTQKVSRQKSVPEHNATDVQTRAGVAHRCVRALKIPAHRVLTFKPSVLLRDAVNAGKASS